MKTKTLFIALIGLFFVASSFVEDKPAAADVIFKDALAQAKKENKRVFIMFHASWCGWCKKMDASMNDPQVKAYFDRNYVIKHITVMESKGKENLENPGGVDMLKKYNSEGDGLPTWFVFDSKGTLLADSKIRPEGAGLDVKGENIGCPAAENEVKAFIKVLKKSSDMKQDELDKVFSLFRKNDPSYKI